MNPKANSENPNQAASPDSKAYQQALRYLSSRMRSEWEVRNHLHRKGHTDAAVAPVMRRLRELRYIDDAEYASVYISSRQRLKPRGIPLLRQELARKGIGRDIIHEKTAALDELAAARQLAGSRLERWQHLDAAGRRTRMTALLRRRGFAWDTIAQVWQEIREITD